MKLPFRSLRGGVHALEDAIITLSGPGIALSGIIAGVDLLTGGHAMASVPWLTMTWAICLLLSLDFQVLALGARAHQVYLSNRTPGRKIAEVVLSVVIAAAISYVSIQMQSIVAEMNAANLTIDQATSALGINANALIFERSILVLVLIFLSGWFRLEQHTAAASSLVVQPLELEEWFTLVVQMNQGMLNQFFGEHYQQVVQLNQATVNQVGHHLNQLREEFTGRLNQVIQLNQADLHQLNQGMNGRLNHLVQVQEEQLHQLEQRVIGLLEQPHATQQSNGLALVQSQIDELLERLSRRQQGQIEAVFSRCIEQVFVREEFTTRQPTDPRMRSIPAGTRSVSELPLNQAGQGTGEPLNQQPAQLAQDENASLLLNQLASSGGSEGAARVVQYLNQCKAAGAEPSLTQIEQACQVSRNTAIAGRRKWNAEQEQLLVSQK